MTKRHGLLRAPMRDLPLLLAGILLHESLVHRCSAFDLRSFLTGEGSGDDGTAASATKRRVKLPKVVSRDLETSVAATDWPTTSLSPLCEGWAFLDAGPPVESAADSTARSNSKISSRLYEEWKWSYLDIGASGIANGASQPSASVSDATTLSYDDAVELAVRSVALARPGATVGTRTESDDRVMDVAKSFDDSFEGRILRYNLALRTYSPLCELHRTLARDTAIGSGIYDPYDGAVSATPLPGAFAVVYPSNVVGTDASAVLEAYRKTKTASSDDSSGQESPLLPGERTRSGDDISDKAVIVLYGQFGTANFTKFYSTLSSNSVPFVVRNMGAIDFEESGEHTGLTGFSAETTALQGYGVRLDIRNLEYKVFDDKADTSDDNEAGEVDVDEVEGMSASSLRPEFLAGFNLTRLADRADLAMEDSSTLEFLSSVQTKLIESDHSQSFKAQTVPPQWQRRDLPLQAARVVSTAFDPLWALQDIAQNLPSHASTLVEVDVPDEIRIAAEIASEMPIVMSSRSDQGPFALFVNGRRIAVQRPSFNLFELMDILRQEDALLARLEQKLGQHIGPVGLASVQEMIEMGESALDKAGSRDGHVEKLSDDAMDMFRDEDYDGEEDNDAKAAGATFRIDVGRGYRGAVAYINDIERDPQYRQWPRSVQQMLMMAQFGQPPTIRRNMFTMLIVMDPLSGRQSRSLDIAIQFIQANMPLRLGFLFVSDADIDNCKSSGGDACTFSPLDVGDAVDLPDLKGIRATTQAASLLINGLIQKYGGMAALGFVDMLVSTWKGQSSLKDLVEIYVDFLRRSSIASDGKAVEYALSVLAKSTAKRDEVDNRSADILVHYANSVDFALSKAVRPGMSFLNGLPLPDSPRETQKIFFEEQNHIMQLAANGKITDSK